MPQSSCKYYFYIGTDRVQALQSPIFLANPLYFWQLAVIEFDAILPQIFGWWTSQTTTTCNDDDNNSKIIVLRDVGFKSVGSQGLLFFQTFQNIYATWPWNNRNQFKLYHQHNGSYESLSLEHYFHHHPLCIDPVHRVLAPRAMGLIFQSLLAATKVETSTKMRSSQLNQPTTILSRTIGSIWQSPTYLV